MLVSRSGLQADGVAELVAQLQDAAHKCRSWPVTWPTVKR